MSTASNVGRIGYVLKADPLDLTYQDFDRLEIDLAQGGLCIGRNGQTTLIALSEIRSLSIQVPGQKPVRLIERSE